MYTTSPWLVCNGKIEKMCGIRKKTCKQVRNETKTKKKKTNERVNWRKVQDKESTIYQKERSERSKKKTKGKWRNTMIDNVVSDIKWLYTAQLKYSSEAHKEKKNWNVFDGRDIYDEQMSLFCHMFYCKLCSSSYFYHSFYHFFVCSVSHAENRQQKMYIY